MCSNMKIPSKVLKYFTFWDFVSPLSKGVSNCYFPPRIQLVLAREIFSVAFQVSFPERAGLSVFPQYTWNIYNTPRPCHREIQQNVVKKCDDSWLSGDLNFIFFPLTHIDFYTRTRICLKMNDLAERWGSWRKECLSKSQVRDVWTSVSLPIKWKRWSVWPLLWSASMLNVISQRNVMSSSKAID